MNDTTAQQHTFFVTGTDTDVGKTQVTCALIRAVQGSDKTAIGLKPIAAGSEYLSGQWKNDDAVLLQHSSSIALDYELTNPYALKAPIAPHIAAQQEEVELSISHLVDHYHAVIKSHSFDYCFIEGAGGWLVPLNQSETFADYVEQLQLPVILVVGIKLGCINHSLLTVQAIHNRGLILAGWVANCIDQNTLSIAENIEYLKNHVAAPLIGTIPFQDPINNDLMSTKLDIQALAKNEN